MTAVAVEGRAWERTTGSNIYRSHTLFKRRRLGPCNCPAGPGCAHLPRQSVPSWPTRVNTAHQNEKTRMVVRRCTKGSPGRRHGVRRGWQPRYMHRQQGAKHHTEGQKHLENLRAQKTGSKFKNRRMNASKVPGHRESVGLQARERMWAGKANGPNSCRYMAMSRLHICRKHEMAVAWQQAMKPMCMCDIVLTCVECNVISVGQMSTVLWHCLVMSTQSTYDKVTRKKIPTKKIVIENLPLACHLEGPGALARRPYD